MATIDVGDLVMREISDPAAPWGSRLEITHADPIIAVGAGLMELIKCHMLTAAMCDTDPRAVFSGGVLTLYSTNRPPLIYRQVAYDEDRDLFIFAWPD